jgi:hypothetical protein
MTGSVKTVCVLAACLALAGGAAAHHSFAMFDQSKPVTLVGTVREFQFTNPHAFIELTAPAAAGGAATDWSIELNSPNNLRRQGWSRDSLKPGDKVTVVINPLREARNGGLFVFATLADGKTLGDPNQGRSGPINSPGLK